jgi:hypothetical protein
VLAGIGLAGLVILSLGTPDACAVHSVDIIGPEGGSVQSEDGRFTLEIPADALATEVEISVEAVECQQEGEADCYQVTPEGIAFREPAAAIYEAAELMAMESVSLSSMGPTGWQPLADAVVDREDETITASVLYLSTFSIQAK